MFNNVPNVKRLIREHHQPTSYTSKSKFPKTPTATLVVHCQADDRLYVGNGKKWIPLNTGPDAPGK